jgi:hypothetical protein
MAPEIAARLRERGFQVVDTATHYLLSRGECIALLERTPAGPGSLGSTGILTPNGLAYLVLREGCDMLAARGSLVPATPAQSEAVRAFSADLKSILG